jgi:riboflavin kinase
MTDSKPRGLESTIPKTLRAVAQEEWAVTDNATIITLAEDLNLPKRRVSRTIRELATRGFVERNGGEISLTTDGKKFLWKEYTDYKRIMGNEEGLVLRGSVTSGLGKGKRFVSLPGYEQQFVSKLGYQPYPGTLNVTLTRLSIRRRLGLSIRDGVHIEEWSDEDTTYGAADCYPVTLEAETGSVGSAHAIVPIRTEHDADELEIIAPMGLRTELSLDDGDTVTVTVE